MNIPSPTVAFTEFKGGLDQSSKPLKAHPGACAASENFEIGINGGYGSIRGYERYDGKPSPSSAKYKTIKATITGEISVGDIINGETSGAQGHVLHVGDGYLAFAQAETQIVEFQDSENILVSSVVRGASTSSPVYGGAPTVKLHAIFTNLAADVYREPIERVPGDGKILGIWKHAGVVYAARNKTGSSEAGIYKAVSIGATKGWKEWTPVKYLDFTAGGTGELSAGDSIAGGISGATADILKVILESGSWAGGDAAGRLFLTNISGTFQAEDIQKSAVYVAAISGDTQSVQILPNGRFEYARYNFGPGEKIYLCDGVNSGFEFDGPSGLLIPIKTNVTPNTPTHVAVHKNHLFFSFDRSVQHSSVADPYTWSPITGASEINAGDTITALKAEPGADGSSALVIYSRNLSHILYGSSPLDWNLVKYRDEIGALPYTVQTMNSTLFMDEKGITNLSATQAFGNFQSASLSKAVQPFLFSRKDKSVASCICREKNQYRLFFSDKYAIFATVDGSSILGFMPVRLNHAVTCISSEESYDGSEEEIFFGSDDGFVYQMERGTSFDGDDIQFYFRLHYNFMKSPRVKKSFKDCALEVTGDGYSECSFSSEIGYSSSILAQPSLVQSNEYSLFSSRWDSFYWDNFYWDSQLASISKFKLSGSAENIALIVRGSGDYFAPIQFSGALIRYIPRRQLR